MLIGGKIKFFLIISAIATVLVAGGFLYHHYSEKWRHTFHVTFLNIGQGDSALIQFADGKTMLVDCGPDKKILSELGKNLPVYVRTIDYVLATHPDLDHYGGCVDVLRRYQVKHIIINGREKQDGYYKEWERAMQSEPGADITVVRAPQTMTIASSTLTFLAPDDSLNLDVSKDDSNNYSIVFKLISNIGSSFIFTGDMEQPLENALVERYCKLVREGVQNFVPLRPITSTVRAQYTVPSFTSCPTLQSDTLKVGHHGSDSSSSELFLHMVSPKQAVISVGKNKYGHPSLRTIRHLERTGAQILRTDTVGDIMIK